MTRRFDRVLLITLDGVGIGALPDAAAYGDADAATLQHVQAACGGLKLPHLAQLGLWRIDGLDGPPVPVQGAFGRLRERSAGKDSTAGHWELAGLIQQQPLPTFPHGFPTAIIDAFRDATGLEPLGNICASGTEILRLLGEEHLCSGRPIVYTSVDSVFQVAAHEERIPVEELYRLCRIARELLNPWRIGRVIARPFIGINADSFIRTHRRHDFSLPPVGPTLLDRLLEAGLTVHGVGKISDLFAARGLNRSTSTRSNEHGMTETLRALEGMAAGLVFTNLIDFDMLYGHRRDAVGFGRALEAFDRWLPELLTHMGERDLLLLTADHGCDPVTAGTDHTREYVPLLAWHPGLGTAIRLGERDSFADVGASVADNFGVPCECGRSFLAELV